MGKLTSLFRYSLVVAVLLASIQAAAEPIWIDVRSAAEYEQDHIDGDMLIPHQDIVEQVEKLYPDPSTEIVLYCRSGGRAGKAMSALKAAGYENVSNAGGIEDARKMRGLTE